MDYPPVLRPSLPAICRKRPFCQGQALAGRFAGLDIHGRASGIKCLRVTDVDASGGGSVNGYIHSKGRKAKDKRHSRHSRKHCFKITHVNYQNTNRLHFAYPQNRAPYAANFIAVYKAVQAAFSFRFTTQPLCGIQPGHSAFVCPKHAGCGQSANAVPIPCGLSACAMLAAYRQNARRIPISNLPVADFSHSCFRKYAVPFVRRYFRRPAYVSSIRFAYSLTAGEGLRPFEPQKAERQERQ